MDHPDLAKRLVVGIIDGLASQDIITLYMDWLRALGGFVSPSLTSWPGLYERYLLSLIWTS